MNTAVVALVLASTLVTGCGRGLMLRERRVNAKLFKDPATLYEKSTTLRKGMTEQEYFEALGLNTNPSKIPNIEFLNSEGIALHRFGNAFLRPGDNFPSYNGYKLPFLAVKKSLSPNSPIHFDINLRGHELFLISVFNNGGLDVSKLEGRARINEKDVVWIYDLLGKTLEGGATQGGKEFIKSVR